MGQIYTIPKYIKNEIEKRIYNFPWNEKKKQPLRHLVELSIWRGGQSILDISINKMDSKVIKFHQCFLEGSHAVLIGFNSEL